MITVETPVPPARVLLGSLTVSVLNVVAVIALVVVFSWPTWWLMVAGWFIHQAAGNAALLWFTLRARTLMAEADRAMASQTGDTLRRVDPRDGWPGDRL